MQNTHGPFEVPPEYAALYDFADNPRLNTFNGMVSVVDSAVGNIVRAPSPLSSLGRPKMSLRLRCRW